MAELMIRNSDESEVWYECEVVTTHYQWTSDLSLVCALQDRFYTPLRLYEETT